LGAWVLIILGIPVVHIILGMLDILGMQIILEVLGVLDILVILGLLAILLALGILGILVVPERLAFLENCSQSPFLLSQATHVAERFHLVNLLTR